MKPNPCDKLIHKGSPVCGSDGVTYPNICQFNWYKRYCLSDHRLGDPEDILLNGFEEINKKLTVINLKEC